jgi:hypothetical protein
MSLWVIDPDCLPQNDTAGPHTTLLAAARGSSGMCKLKGAIKTSPDLVAIGETGPAVVVGDSTYKPVHPGTKLFWTNFNKRYSGVKIQPNHELTIQRAPDMVIKLKNLDYEGIGAQLYCSVCQDRLRQQEKWY